MWQKSVLPLMWLKNFATNVTKRVPTIMWQFVNQSFCYNSLLCHTNSYTDNGQQLPVRVQESPTEWVQTKVQLLYSYTVGCTLSCVRRQLAWKGREEQRVVIWRAQWWKRWWRWWGTAAAAAAPPPSSWRRRAWPHPLTPSPGPAQSSPPSPPQYSLSSV